MASQVTNWIYAKQDDVRYFNTNMDYAIAVDTLPEAYRYFSSTYYMERHANIFDNRLREAGLIVRPLTSDYGKTGVMVFDITHPDAKYRSSSRCCYGQASMLLTIMQVFRAAGLDIDEDYVVNYRTRVAARVLGDPGLQQILRANVCLENGGGYHTLGYCDKLIVDAILDAMAKEGMFNQHYDDMPEEIEANTTMVLEPLFSIEDAVDLAIANSLYAPAVVQFRVDNPTYEDWIPTVEDIMPLIEAGFTANGIDIEDYKYCNVYINFNNPILGYPNDIGISIALCNFIDDELTNITAVPLEEHDDYTQGYTGWQYSYQRNEFMNNIPLVGGSYDRPFLYFSIDTDNQLQGSYTFQRSNNSFDIGIYNMAYSYITEAAAFSPKNYKGQASACNYGFAGSYPAGISVHEGAVVPKNVSALSTDFWADWDTNTYMDHLLGSMTYVALGFGDFDNPSWSQARVQSGEIYNDHYQELLGVNIESLDEFITIAEAYYGEDVDPIIPSPDPTPSPTPVESDVSLSSSRLFTVHSLSDTEVDNLGNFIYSNDFISAITNMFTEPMDAIIGCFVLCHGGSLPLGTSETLKLGSIMGTTGVTGTKLTNQFAKLDCGSVNVNEYYNNVEDYDYSSAQIFLPFIGYRDLDVKEIMGGRVNVVYHIDCFSGACLARIYVTKDGVKQELYNFSGNCSITIPLTGRDFTRGVTSILSGALVIAGGAATGNAMAMAYGASNMIGDLATFKRSGGISANIGAMGCQKPFIVIKRPVPYNALNYPAYYGKPSNWTVTLSSCSGYTRVKDIHLDGIACTDDERREIERLLKQGVML